MSFEALRLIDPLVRAVRAAGYTAPTPIQTRAIPHVLDGRDVLGCAQTGTGKTAAFALPILQRLTGAPPLGRGHRPVRVLVLSPTRELAAQIGDSFTAYGRDTSFITAVIFGGVGQEPQTRALRGGVDILVATPGRLLDLMGQGFVRFDRLEVLVLDEADRMLDMGFIHDVRRIVAALPRRRQTLFFSATLPRDIQDLARDILRDPVRVEVAPAATTVETIEQALYFVEKPDKRALLSHVLADPAITRALVFTRTKHGADRVVRHLGRGGGRAEAIHGNKSQGARERALANFKRGATRALVATDIAARGIDVDAVSHVINFDLPNEPEVYVHRIGRTGRAGAAGVALSFCDLDERECLADIEQLIGARIPIVAEHPYRSPHEPPSAASAPRRGRDAARRRPPPAPARRDGSFPPSGEGRGRRRPRPRPAGTPPHAAAGPPPRPPSGAGPRTAAPRADRPEQTGPTGESDAARIIAAGLRAAGRRHGSRSRGRGR